MRKVTVDLMLGRRNRSLFRKLGPKSTMVAAQLPVSTATKSSSYGLRFGKIGLNAGEICEKFNTMTTPLWRPNVLLPMIIFISPTKTQVMEIKYPTIYTFLNVILDMGSKEKTIVELPRNKAILLRIFYKIALMKSLSINKKIIVRWVRQIIGCYESMDLANPWRKLKKKI